LQLNSALFDVIITPESTIEHKPHPAPALKAIELLGVSPEETIMIGNSMHDLQCGRQAGCRTAFVQYSMVPHQELLACNPDYSFEKLSDIITIL
ncbi:MAG: HAD hydrolase-like protein, partial [Peptococcaceae bacterium]|nr:HAD hydrolase-like protein [Peptococcaceae bacterium]